MTTHFDGDNLSEAWSAAFEHLLGIKQPRGKALHLTVAFPADGEDLAVRSAIDDFLSARRQGERPYSVETVANTLFPEGLYVPALGEGAQDHLYELHEVVMRAHRRRSRDKVTYFDRLVAYPSTHGEPFNQLRFVIDRLRSQRARNNPLSSAYETGLSSPSLDARVQVPGQDTGIMSFPCLSHVSFTLHQGLLNITALYRNHTFVTRAYGNYLGLVRLLRFVANESGCVPGEVLCVSTHADAETTLRGGMTALRELSRAVSAAANGRGRGDE